MLEDSNALKFKQAGVLQGLHLCFFVRVAQEIMEICLFLCIWPFSDKIFIAIEFIIKDSCTMVVLSIFLFWTLGLRSWVSCQKILNMLIWCFSACQGNLFYSWEYFFLQGCIHVYWLMVLRLPKEPLSSFLKNLRLQWSWVMNLTGKFLKWLLEQP